MTVIETRPPDVEPVTPSTPRAAATRHAPLASPTRPAEPATAAEGGIAVASAWTLVLLAAVLLGFGLYLFTFSNIQQSRAQSNLFKTFRHELALAVAPSGPTTEGAPVALLNIPQIGLSNEVVVEGTSGGSLTLGPGHRVDTSLPGQAGISVLYGRSVTFGAPFGRLDQLHVGDQFTVVSANGTARFRVTGFNSDPLPDNGLVLSTATGQWQPNTTTSVIAQLVSKPATPAVRGALPAGEAVLDSDFDAVLPLMLWSLALCAVAALATLLRYRWSAWPAYVCAAPVALAVLWNVYENAAQLLPNVY